MFPNESAIPFQALFELVPWGVLVLDAELRVSYMNRVALERTGLSAAHHLGQDLRELLPKLREGTFTSMLERCRDSGVPLQYEGPCPFGSDCDAQVRVTIRRVGEHVALILEDITAHQEREGRLAELLARFRAAFENASIGRSLTSPDGRLEMVNAALCRLLGYEKEELELLTFAEITHPDDLAASREFVRSLLAGEHETLQLEKRYRHKDGHFIDTIISSSLVRDSSGKPLHFVTDIIDLSAHRRTEAALEESEALFRRLFDDHTAVKMIVDMETGLIFDVNRAATRYYGWSAEQLKAMRIWDINTLSEAEVRKEMSAAVSRERNYFEFRHRLADGRVRDVVVFGSSFVHHGRTLLHSIVHDVTEAVAARREADALRERMNQSQKLENIGKLTGAIAHDFNNLLTVIGSYAGFALDSLPSDEPVRNEIQQIQSATRRAIDLTRQLLAFSREQELEPRPVDVHVVLGELSRMLERLLGEAVTLRVMPAGELPPAFVDPGQLQQVLVNLCINARDAMPDGGQIEIRAERRGAQGVTDLAETTVSPGNYVVISVADDGCGMDPETLRRIFEPFFTTKPPGKGTGLGLSTVYGIVRQSRGYIDVRSSLGQGTTFYVALPEAGASKDGSSEPEPKLPGGGAGELVLLAEDEEEVRHVVSRVLGRAGYRVLAAADGAGALGLFEASSEEFGLLLTDAVMPGMSGIELARRLRERRPGFPVVIMSGYLDERISGELAIQTDIRFLRKPFSVAELCATVREALLAGSSGAQERVKRPDGKE